MMIAPHPNPLPARAERVILLALLCLATVAHAQDAGSSLLDQLDAAAASTVDAGAAPASSLLDELDAAAGAPVVKPVTAPSPNIFVRAIQSLNPDMSVILDGVAGYSQRAPLRLSGDDPDLGGSASTEAAGFNMQEVEFGFQGAVDPYFRADVFLTIPNLSGLEVEEAFVTTSSLPLDLQVKAGIFRSALGRQNGQHLHTQSFTRRPLLNASYLAADGLRAPGAQVSWLAPLPFFLQLNLEAFSTPLLGGDTVGGISAAFTFRDCKRSCDESHRPAFGKALCDDPECVRSIHASRAVFRCAIGSTENAYCGLRRRAIRAM